MGGVSVALAVLRRVVYAAAGRPGRLLRERPDERRVWTIGHSNHAIDTLLELLRRHRIEALFDVRSYPTSKFARQFDRRALERSVSEAGLAYVFLGRELGGRPSGAQFYDADGRVDYRRVARSDPFRRGIGELGERAARSRVAILCAEEDPLHCHRRRLVGRVLVERGMGVEHIRGDGSVEAEAAVAAREAAIRAGAGQLSLLSEVEDAAWMSTRSVSRKGRRPTSSER